MDEGVEYIDNGPFDETAGKGLIQAFKAQKSPDHPQISIDFSPMDMPQGRVIPGKAMLEPFFAEPEYALEELQRLYEVDDPSHVLMIAAIALDHLSKEEARFPSAMLTDIRDFLKLRCGANGLTTEAEDASLIEAIRKEDVDYLVNYAVGALDDLSKRPVGTDFAKSVYSIREAIRAAGRIIDTRPTWQSTPH